MQHNLIKIWTAYNLKTSKTNWMKDIALFLSHYFYCFIKLTTHVYFYGMLVFKILIDVSFLHCSMTFWILHIQMNHNYISRSRVPFVSSIPLTVDVKRKQHLKCTCWDIRKFTLIERAFFTSNIWQTNQGFSIVKTKSTDPKTKPHMLV